MSGISNSLRHELGMQGISVKKSEAVLTPQSEYDFMATCIRFLKQFEQEVKLKKVDKRMTLNEFVAQAFPKFLGGRKEEIERKVNSFICLLDLWSQSQTIELYKWLFDINPRVNLVAIHNKILDKFKHLDPEFMDTARKSLKNVSFPFKDMVDVVGKFIHYKSLRVFIENVESGQKMKRGGIQDRKVPAILLLKAALEADYECGGLEIRDNEQVQTEDRFKYNDDKHNYYLKPKEEKFVAHREMMTSTSKGIGMLAEQYDPDVIPEVEDVLKNSEEVVKDRGDPVQDLTKIAHRYLFGKPQSVNQVKKIIDGDFPRDEELSTNDLLQKDIQELEKKYQAALKRNEDSDHLYNLVLQLFNEYKQNYYIIGNEVNIMAKLTNFLMIYYEDNPENMKILKNIKNLDVIEIKKLKLLIGKCFEKTSFDAQYEFKRVYKFAIDYADYENDILKGDKQDQVFELLQKSPPVPDQKGLRNARAKVRELRDFDQDSPVKDKSLQKLLEGDDVRDIMALLQSEYYAESRIAQAKQASQDQDMDYELVPMRSEDDGLLDFRVPANVLDGMVKLIMRRFMPKSKSRSSSKSRKSSRSKSAKSKKSTKSKGSKKSGKVLRKKKSASKSKSRSKSKSVKSKRSKSAKSAKSKSASKSKSRSKSKSKKGGKKVKKTKKTKKSTKKKSETSNPDATMSFNTDTKPEIQRAETKQISPKRRPREPWREDDPVFLSPATSRSKSIDPDIEYMLERKQSVGTLEEEDLDANEQLYQNAVSREGEDALSSERKKRIVKKKKKKGKKKSGRSKSKASSKSRSKSKTSKKSKTKTKAKPSRSVSKSSKTGTSKAKPKTATATARPKSSIKSSTKPTTGTTRTTKPTVQPSKQSGFSVNRPGASKSPIPGKRKVGNYKA